MNSLNNDLNELFVFDFSQLIDNDEILGRMGVVNSYKRNQKRRRKRKKTVLLIPNWHFFQQTSNNLNDRTTITAAPTTVLKQVLFERSPFSFVPFNHN